MTTPASAAKAREIVQRWFDGTCTPPIPVEQLRALDDAIAAALDEIRSLRGEVSQRSLARRFGVARTTIQWIQNGRNWQPLAASPLPKET